MKLKILLAGPSSTGGGYEQIKAYEHFLSSKSHKVDVVLFPRNDYTSKFWFYYQRARARLEGHEKRYIVKTADKLERIIKAGTYDATIGFGVEYSYALTRDLGCLKLFAVQTPEADGLYFSKKINLERIRSYREIELEIMMKSDYVIFPWETTENYVKKYVWNGDNFRTIKYGCYPREKVASYFFPPSIVSIGNIAHYWANKELLSNLTNTSPYVIDVYGKYKPERRYNIRYKGFANSLDVLYNYQFGLNTVVKSIDRRNGHASRILTYLAYGLPVLSPDWMKFSSDLRGVLSYNEDNFTDLVDKYSDRDSWKRLSQEAHEQALDLDWDKTLEALETLISKQS